MMLKYYVEKANPDDLYEKLKNDYPQIFKEMQKEKYILEYPTYGFIREIRFENRTVGIVVLQKFKEITFKYGVSTFYIMPQYRNRDIIFKTFLDLITATNIELYIRKPSKSLVKNLIKCGLAQIIGRTTVISSIPFACDTGEIFENVNLKEYHEKIGDKNDEYIHVSRYYTLKYGGVIISKDPDFLPKGLEAIMITAPQKNDLNFNMRKKLKKLTTEDLKDISLDLYLFNEAEPTLEKNVQMILKKALSVDKLIGSPTRLEKTTIDYLKENGLTKKEGFKIRKKIVDALESDEINNKNILKRLYYLVCPEIIEPITLNLSLECPFCKNQIDYIQKDCLICGHDLRNERLFKSVEKIANRQLDECDFSILDDDDLQVNAMFSTKLIKHMEENEYDEEAVFKNQSLYVCYCIIKSLKDNLDLPQGVDLANKIKEGGGLIYGINHEYLKLLDKDTYTDILLNKLTVDEIKSEMRMFGLEDSSDDRLELISKILEDEFFERFHDDRFYPTKKGFELLECDLLKYYDEKVDKKYLFFEFKKLWDENIDKSTPDEIHEMLVEK